MKIHRGIRLCGIISAALLLGSIFVLFPVDAENANSQSGLTSTPMPTRQVAEDQGSTRVLMPFVATGSGTNITFSYSNGNASGDLMVQGFTSFNTPGITMDESGGPYSCQQGNHINESMWMFAGTDHPLRLNESPTLDWMEVGFIGGIDLANPNSLHGCGIAYYYANYPLSLNGNPDIKIPMGLGAGPHNYWIRFENPTPRTTGMYVIIDGVDQIHYRNQACCSGAINVGLEYQGDINSSQWSLSVTDDTPLAYYDLNWNVHNWSGCTMPGFPNNCSHQDARMGGRWVNAWNDYQNWFPLQ